MAEYGTHQTKLYLTKVEWDNSYSDTKLFSNATEQYNYFYNLSDTFKGFEMDNSKFRFIDGDSGNARKRDIKVSLRPEVAQTYNYAFYSNDNGNTWHYMFVNSADYINYETALLHLEEDLMQNYMFSFEFMPSIIERQTVSSEIDNKSRVGDYLPFDTEYISNKQNLFTNEQYLPYICCIDCISSQAGSTLSTWNHTNTGSYMNGKHIPFTFIVCADLEELMQIKNWHEAINDMSNPPKDPDGNALKFDIKNFISYGYVSKQIIPRPMIISNRWPHSEGSNPFVNVYGSSNTLQSTHDVLNEAVTSTTYSRPQILEGQNVNSVHKMICSPYCNIELNHLGRTMQLKPENFGSNTITFDFSYTFTDTFHCAVTPRNYTGEGTLVDCYSKIFEPIVGCTFPIDVDGYLQYISQNKANIETQRIGNGVSAVMGIGKIAAGIGLAVGTEGVSSAITGSLIMSGAGDLIGTATNTVAQENQLNEKANMQTKELVGAYGSDYLACAKNWGPKIYIRQPYPNEVKQIEKYLSMNGYATNSFGIPEIDNRQNWDYVKTKGCRIKPKQGIAFMNNEAKLQIQSIFDKGIRLWHVNVGQYNNYNNPVG